MAKKTLTPRPVIGWREWIGLPELGIERVKVKVDTGARSSAIHASRLQFFDRDGERWVKFEVHPIQRDSTITVTAEVPLWDKRAVKDSGGNSERRVVIRTPMEFMGEVWPIELTLTNRDSMGFRMLLGREAVRKRFTVDPGRSYVGGRPLKSTKKRSKKKKKKKAKIQNAT